MVVKIKSLSLDCYTVGSYLFFNLLAILLEVIFVINRTPYSYCQCNVTGVGFFTVQL